MSSKLGPVVFGDNDEAVFLGKEIAERKNYSEEIAYKIDREITHLIREAHKTASRILKDKKSKLAQIADVLMKKETLERKEFENLMAQPV